jgi:excisionase family DNA binding protein
MSDKDLMTKVEVREYLRLSRGTLDRLMKKRDIPFIKLEKRVLFRKSDIDAFLKKHLIEKK